MTATAITKYKITHYQYVILHNREFRSFGNRKKYFKSTTVTLQGNDVRIYLCLHCIIVNNNNKNKLPIAHKWVEGIKIVCSFRFVVFLEPFSFLYNFFFISFI
jgi:hypothetical protein